MDISIVIVNYKRKGLTLNCLQSLYATDWGDLSYEIIVVDNASGDNSVEIIRWQFPDVILIESLVNLGMGGGNNLGFSRAKGKYLCVMNPDTLVFPNTIPTLYAFMKANSQVGLVGPKQYNPNHTVQDSCFRWHSALTPLYRRTFLGQTVAGRQDLSRFLMTDFDKESSSEVDWLLGSFMFIRGEALLQVGGFDERFFLYFEDTDLCRRFHRKSWRVVYYPGAEIIHNHNRESAQTPWYYFFTSVTTRTHIVSWIKYLLKWKGV
ncbi:hypothetical protein COT94_00460 [Candidatus Falkowbacteria bacterium CG10_big_fil_rev_8_21_14_0_10_37_14]|uniref:Glycosyltransferase 2-like domain-containing protein n=1 Tax=Candidatus Falkowbacteria bacterium CG10_big_fil_rev_8_21_14_0_10_37_14 TaxID=1974561 RepID=A0A2M6WUG3_9BACT|nr:glycosyltransferase family 2 protein [Candidatus Falkowbacteria bacterium]PIT96420.1 MAG: hypothetical protein COT94_00460 [Candidatus Falkowbacteria bacterium CG10_big_fil_rev_8_21_14_0_10_37_14]